MNVLNWVLFCACLRLDILLAIEKTVQAWQNLRQLRLNQLKMSHRFTLLILYVIHYSNNNNNNNNNNDEDNIYGAVFYCKSH